MLQRTSPNAAEVAVATIHERRQRNARRQHVGRYRRVSSKRSFFCSWNVVGPMGRNGEATGAVNTHGKVAAMYSYSKTKGLFGEQTLFPYGIT